MTYCFNLNLVQLISGIEVSNTIVFLNSSVLPICFKSAIFQSYKTVQFTKFNQAGLLIKEKGSSHPSR